MSDHAEHDHHDHSHGHHPQSDHPHSMPHDFSDAEKWSAVFDAAERDAWQKPAEIVALMAIKPGMTVADLGAGTGYFLNYLSAAVGTDGRVLALDPEPNLVEHIGRRAEREGWGNVEPRRIPFDDPGLAAGSVDRLLIVNTWHHLGARSAYATKLRLALKPGGRIYVVDYTRDSPTGPPPEHRLEPDEIIAELRGGGLEAELVAEDLPRQYIVMAEPP